LHQHVQPRPPTLVVPRLPANAHFIEGDMLTMPLAGYDVIVAIQCAYYLNEAERSLFIERIAAAHRGKLFILSAPIIGKPYFTDREIQQTLARDWHDTRRFAQPNHLLEHCY
jgi:hypothetical protein